MTKSDLMRDAKKGILSIELLPEGTWAEQTTSTGCINPCIPPRLQGVRKVTGANTVGLFLDRADGKGSSQLYLGPASLIEYTGESLKIFRPGYREPNPEEQETLDAWDEIANTTEFKKRAYVDAVSDGSSTFYQKKTFFENRKMEHLLGWGERRNGAKLDFNRIGQPDFISDNHIRGALSLHYRVYREEVA